MTLSRRAFHSVVGKAFGTALPLSVGRLQNLALSRVVPEQLLNQIDVGHDHPAATVSLEAKLVHCVSVERESIRGNTDKFHSKLTRAPHPPLEA